LGASTSGEKMRNIIWILLLLVGIVFLFVGALGIIRTGVALKSANINSAFVAFGVILLLSSLQYFLISRQKEDKRKWVSIIKIAIPILMIVAVINGLGFLFLPDISSGFKLFVCTAYILVPILNIIYFSRTYKWRKQL
jgi:multisubunit Na+/H+ antiporter MnhG subunit